MGSGGRHTAGGLLLHDDDAKIRFVCGARLAPLMGSGGRDITKGLGGWCGEVGGQGRRGSEGRTVIRTKKWRFLLGQLGQCKAASWTKLLWHHGHGLAMPSWVTVAPKCRSCGPAPGTTAQWPRREHPRYRKK